MHTINIELEKKSDNVELRIIDDGSKFNPLEAKEVDLNTSLKDKPIGGLGIHFVKQKADDLFYERKNDKNILTIIKRLNVNGE